MMLYSMYKLYNTTDTFKNNLAEIEKMYMEEKINDNVNDDKKLIQYFQYIFKVKKILNSKEYTLSYYRQYIFWETVIKGGILFNYKLAAKLLKHSLSEIGDDPKTYNITDQDIINDIKKMLILLQN